MQGNKVTYFVCKTFIFFFYYYTFPFLVQYIMFPPIPIFLSALHSVFFGTHHCHSTGDGGGWVIRLLSSRLAAKEKFLVFVCQTLVEVTLKRWGLPKGV